MFTMYIQGPFGNVLVSCFLFLFPFFKKQKCLITFLVSRSQKKQKRFSFYKELLGTKKSGFFCSVSQLLLLVSFFSIYFYLFRFPFSQLFLFLLFSFFSIIFIGSFFFFQLFLLVSFSFYLHRLLQIIILFLFYSSFFFAHRLPLHFSPSFSTTRTLPLRRIHSFHLPLCANLGFRCGFFSKASQVKS